MLRVRKYKPRASSHVTDAAKETSAIIFPKGKYWKQPESLNFEYESYQSKFHLNVVKQVQQASYCRPCTNQISHGQHEMCIGRETRQTSGSQFPI